MKASSGGGRDKLGVPAPPKTAPIFESFSQRFPRLLRQPSRDTINRFAIAPASPDQGLTARDSHLPAGSAGSHGNRRIQNRGCPAECPTHEKLHFMRSPFTLSGTAFLCVTAFWLNPGSCVYAQNLQSPFNNLDLVQIYVNSEGQHSKKAERERIASNKGLVDSGAASILDLSASPGALQEFDRALSLLKGQNPKEAIKHLQRAIKTYPKFVSAHVNLGIAYLDQNDSQRARSEFETAAKLDDKFSRSFVNLGVLSMSQKDFSSAVSQLEKAATLRSQEAKIWTMLARA